MPHGIGSAAGVQTDKGTDAGGGKIEFLFWLHIFTIPQLALGVNGY